MFCSCVSTWERRSCRGRETKERLVGDVVEVDRGEKMVVGWGAQEGVWCRESEWVVERDVEVPKEEGRRPYSALPFSKSHSSEADGRTASFRSPPLYSTPLCARGGTQCTVPKKVQHPWESMSEGVNPCTGGKRERESERWSMRGWGRQGCRGEAGRRADIDSRGICARSTRLGSLKCTYAVFKNVCILRAL